MAWGRVDDAHYRHPKVMELDEGLRKGCLAMFWLAISWCNDHLTDGRVPPGTVRLLGGTVEEAEELVRVGMWERRTRGYAVHDYLDFNKSREQIETERRQRSEAGKAGADARWNGESHGTSHGNSYGTSLSEMHGTSPNEPISEMDAPSPVPRLPFSGSTRTLSDTTERARPRALVDPRKGTA